MNAFKLPGIGMSERDNYQVLGKGWYGIVIRPPIIPARKTSIFKFIQKDSLSCDTFTDIANKYRYVGKIARENVLRDEYYFINKLVEIDSEYSKLVKGKVKLCTLTEEDVTNNAKSLVRDITNYNETFPVYQLIMPYLGNTFCDFLDPYKKICKIQCKVNVNPTRVNTKLKIVDAVTCKQIIGAFQKLYVDIHNYNASGIFHNDIKPDNLIYNVDTNVLIMIDFNTSIHKQIVNQYVHNIKSYQEIIDKYDFINKVVLYFLSVAFNNQTIYDALYDIYEDFVKYIKIVTSKIKPQYELYTSDFTAITTNFDEKLANLFERVLNMDETYDFERTNNDFCSLNLKNFQSVDEQRKNAKIYSEHAKNKIRENREMGREDKRGGKKTRKKRNKQTKRKTPYRRSRT
jgi:serine/threonine protein kinase